MFRWLRRRRDGEGNRPRGNRASANEQGEQALSAGAQADKNGWQQGGWSESDFRSTDPSGTDGPRPADGGLPGTTCSATTGGRGASMSGD